MPKPYSFSFPYSPVGWLLPSTNLTSIRPAMPKPYSFSFTTPWLTPRVVPATAFVRGVRSR